MHPMEPVSSERASPREARRQREQGRDKGKRRETREIREKSRGQLVILSPCVFCIILYLIESFFITPILNSFQAIHPFFFLVYRKESCHVS